MTITEALPIIINILLCILLVVSIILAIKLIIVVDKADKICDNVSNKVNSLNGLFNAIGLIDKRMTSFIGTVFSGAESLFNRLFDKDNKKKEDK